MYAAFFQAIQSLRNPLVFIVFVQVPEVRDENGFTFRGEALHDGLLIVGGRLTLFERDLPHRALPDTGAEAITVKVADHDRFTVNQLQGSFVATVDAVSTAVAKGFVYSDNRAFHFFVLFVSGKIMATDCQQVSLLLHSEKLFYLRIRTDKRLLWTIRH